MGHIHSIVEYLVSMPEEQTHDLRRRTLAVEFHAQIEATELPTETCLAQSERGVSTQPGPQLDDAVGFEAQLLDRHETEVGAICQIDLHLRNDHRVDIGGTPIEENYRSLGVDRQLDRDVGKGNSSIRDSLDVDNDGVCHHRTTGNIDNDPLRDKRQMSGRELVDRRRNQPQHLDPGCEERAVKGGRAAVNDDGGGRRLNRIEKGVGGQVIRPQPQPASIRSGRGPDRHSARIRRPRLAPEAAQRVPMPRHARKPKRTRR